MGPRENRITALPQKRKREMQKECLAVLRDVLKAVRNDRPPKGEERGKSIEKIVDLGWLTADGQKNIKKTRTTSNYIARGEGKGGGSITGGKGGGILPARLGTQRTTKKKNVSVFSVDKVGRMMQGQRWTAAATCIS